MIQTPGSLILLLVLVLATAACSSAGASAAREQGGTSVESPDAATTSATAALATPAAEIARGVLDPVLIFGWSDFMRAEEQDAIAVMGYPPDTILTAEGQRSLLYRGEEAHLFRFTEGLLDEESHMTYVEGRDSVQAAYDSLVAVWRETSGAPSMEIDTGAMWIYTAPTATDSLSNLVESLLQATAVQPDSVTLDLVLKRANPAQRTQLTTLLGRHRVERIYIQPLWGTTVYSITRTREAGVRALWDSEGNLRALGSL